MVKKKLLIGDWKRWTVLPVYYGGRRQTGHALLIGPPGSGKGQALLCNILRLRSMIIHDLDCENTAVARREWLRKGYRVYLLNGARMFGLPSNSLNPIDYADPNRDDFADRCFFLSGLVAGPTGQEREPFFPSKQLSWRAAEIGWVAATEKGNRRTLLTVRENLTLDGPAFRAHAARLAASEHSFIAAVGNEQLRMADLESRTLDSVLSGGEEDTRFLESEIARTVLGPTDCRLADLKGRDRNGRRLPSCVVSVIMPVANVQDQAATLRLIFGCAMLEMTTGDLAREPVWWLIDEAPALKKFAALTSFLPIARKHQCRVQLVAQSTAQFREIYGEHGFSEIESVCGLKQYLAPRDLETAEFLSRKLGTTTIRTPDKKGEMARPLMTADEVMRLRERRQIVWIDQANPFIGAVRPYWERPTQRFRAGVNPYFGGRLPLIPVTLPFELLLGLILRVAGWVLGPSRTFAVLALLLAAWGLGVFDTLPADAARVACSLDLNGDGRADLAGLCSRRILPWR